MLYEVRKAMTADEVYARLLALEGEAGAQLALVSRDITLIQKEGGASLEDALAALSWAFAAMTVKLRQEVRAVAVVEILAALGSEERYSPEPADDAERGERAAAYYVKHWQAGLGEAGWPAGIEAAREAAAGALADVACYETFDAWNDEQQRAAVALARAGSKAKSQWKTQRDGDVCERCAALHNKVADSDGLFHSPDGKWKGRPPQHKYCRCYVMVDAGKAIEESDDMSMSKHGLVANYPGSQPSPVDHPVVLGDLLKNATYSATLEHPEADRPGLVTRALHVKAIDDKKRTVDFVASTDVVDSHDEIVDQGSWLLEDYLKNPVVLFAHNARELPIGRAVDVAVRNAGGGMQLETRIEFAPAELNPKAEQVFRMLQAKYLRAVSVGFVPRSYRWEMRNGSEVWVWADCVLKEISVTPVPANPEALAKMKSLVPRTGTAAGAAVQSLTRSFAGVATPSPAASGTPTTEKQAATPPRKESTVDLTEKTEKQAVTIANLETEQKALTARAEKAEATVTELTAKLATAETANAAHEAQAKTLTTERDAATARAEKAESTVIDLEVEALVGKKITPAEKPLFVDLRKSNPDLFTKMIAQRADMKLGESITEPGAKNGTPEALNGAAGTEKAIALVEELGK